MARAWSDVVEPHRVLKPDQGDPMRGEDVRALQVATLRRLDARGIDRTLKVDGILGSSTLAAMDTAAFFLGALDSTTRPSAFPVGAQQLIRFPGRRSPSQMARAIARLAALVKQREDAQKAKAHEHHDGPLGMTDSQEIDARHRAVGAMDLLYRHAPAVHYTMGAMRWQGIRYRLRSAEGHFPTWADCSSSVDWAWWNALTGVVGASVPDIISGCQWTAGFTGTQTAHGRWVAPGGLRAGDLIFYYEYDNPRNPIGHVAMARGDGWAYSHGSEAGPLLVRYNYRPIATCRTYL